ncbi:hypothetical protein JXB28_06455 [Candidatus Woesearchaeota archaeon]|nr:hypothetical protein [Candidatus Woesearchaeota archaeon]
MKSSFSVWSCYNADITALCEEYGSMGKIIITKRVAKQGKNSIIVIPADLRELLKAGDLIQIEISKIKPEVIQNER